MTKTKLWRFSRMGNNPRSHPDQPWVFAQQTNLGKHQFASLEHPFPSGPHSRGPDDSQPTSRVREQPQWQILVDLHSTLRVQVVHIASYYCLNIWQHKLPPLPLWCSMLFLPLARTLAPVPTLSAYIYSMCMCPRRYYRKKRVEGKMLKQRYH